MLPTKLSMLVYNDLVSHIWRLFSLVAMRTLPFYFLLSRLGGLTEANFGRLVRKFTLSLSASLHHIAPRVLKLSRKPHVTSLKYSFYFASSLSCLQPFLSVLDFGPGSHIFNFKTCSNEAVLLLLSHHLHNFSPRFSRPTHAIHNGVHDDLPSGPPRR